MTIKKENLKILLIGTIILIVLGAQDTLPKRAVADVEGQACLADKDCPCWGKLVNGTESFGIGSATCDKKTLKCDTTYCIDVQPVGQYLKENPLEWVKDNIIIVFGLIGLLIMLAAWPKQ